MRLNRSDRASGPSWCSASAAQKGSEWNSCRWEGAMKLTIRSLLLILMLISSLAFCFPASAQQAMPSDTRLLQSYDVNREISLIGTVVNRYTASTIPPLGAHVTVQTASGQVDVHLGNARVLLASHFQLNPGDNVRIVGEPMAL